MKVATRRLPAVLTVAFMVCLTVAPQAFGQTLGQGQSPEIPLIRIFAALLICLLIAVVAALVLKRHTGLGGLETLMRSKSATASDRLIVLETRRISVHADVCRFRSGATEYLVVVSPAAATVLEARRLDSSGAQPQVAESH